MSFDPAHARGQLSTFLAAIKERERLMQRHYEAIAKLQKEIEQVCPIVQDIALSAERAQLTPEQYRIVWGGMEDELAHACGIAVRMKGGWI